MSRGGSGDKRKLEGCDGNSKLKAKPVMATKYLHSQLNTGSTIQLKGVEGRDKS